MDDPFLDRLKTEWRTPDVDIGQLRLRVARRQAWARAAPWGNMGSALLLGGLFLWFAVAAIDRQDPVFGLGAFAYLVALIAVLVGSVKSLNDRLIERHEAPLAFLRLHRRLVETVRRSLWGARCAATIMMALCVAIWLMAAVGLAQPADAALLSATWGATGILTWIWQMWRRRRLDDEADSCDRMIAALEDAD
jgi:hypothetical protein